MKIPDNFKQKYHLKGDQYPSANADAALSELFAVSGRLYKENADLKAEVAALREAAENAAPAAVPAEVDLSGIEALISSLAEQIASIRTTVNDTLCVVNDAAISAKKAEDSAKEAKAAAVEAKDASEDALDAAESALAEVRALGEKIESAPITVPVFYPDGAVAAPETKEADEDENVLAFILEENTVEETEEEPAPAEEVIPAPEIIGEEITEAEPETEAVEETVEETVESPAEEEETEAIPEPDPEKDDEAIADDLIRSAGLDSEPEEIEPAEPVDDSDLSARLAKMYADTADEELPVVKREEEEEEPAPAPEKHAPTTFTDMKSALDAIRARLKK